MTPPKKQAGAVGHYATVLATVLAVSIPFVSAFLWAADQGLDEKYATDKDLASVQAVVSQQVKEIQRTVEKNTETVQQTVQSVDSLTLVVLDLQIDKLEQEITRLEREKRRQGANWNEMEEHQLRSKQRSLEDLDIHRNNVFARVINAR